MTNDARKILCLGGGTAVLVGCWIAASLQGQQIDSRLVAGILLALGFVMVLIGSRKAKRTSDH
ncbi:MAG TPA: hypothetical protein VGU69_10500 [Rhizomicrobium sp.]|nr:hypothetical protein [Rhizomicrobium sp.]